ncbi:Hint domain-containing protein [Shimia gijangensis]|uniref:Hint domain-containing protein n=1 Tax=Shimia gijangensis TaxID=1470563 RepID=A0A1M6QPB8_9RHOB|nr:Hint domain-containing protein [Shimia gijangensis]SHK21857.1 Hint domain-containing protein [Shimia gijangensis]
MADPYFTEIRYRSNSSNDFIEVAIDEGTDVSGIQIVVYNPSGTVRSINDIGDYQGTMLGKDVYSLSGVGVFKEGAIALVQDGTVIDFISFDNEVTATGGPADGLTSTQIGSTGNNQNTSVQLDENGNWTTGTLNEGTIPCFLAGTKIATKRGEVAVEDLRPGDMVVVRDGGFAPIRWIGSVCTNARGGLFEQNAPIRIPRGSMGRNMPARDLYVSPNHRIWMRDASFEVVFAEQEVLIPAKHLVGWSGIQQVNYVPEPEYFHLLFDNHQIIMSDGMLTESFHPGEVTMDQFEHEARDELLRLFPELIELASYGDTARRCLKSYEVPLALKVKSAA